MPFYKQSYAGLVHLDIGNNTHLDEQLRPVILGLLLIRLFGVDGGKVDVIDGALGEPLERCGILGNGVGNQLCHNSQYAPLNPRNINAKN